MGSLTSVFKILFSSFFGKNVFFPLLDDLLATVNNFWLTGEIDKEEETFSERKKWNRKEMKGSDFLV